MLDGGAMIADDADAIIEARRTLLRDLMTAIGYCQRRADASLGASGCWCMRNGVGGGVAACPPELPATPHDPDPSPFAMPCATPVPWFPR